MHALAAPPSAAHRALTKHLGARGAVSLFVAFSLPVLLGLVALALDLGRAYVIKAELQNAMDACALAASSALTGTQDPTVFDTGRAYARALIDPAAQGLAARPAASVNRVHFQSETLQPQALEVSYSAHVDGPFVAATAAQTQGLNPAQARYARCRYQDPGRRLWMMPVLQALGLGSAGAQTLSVWAQAVASLQPAQSVCAVPMAVCIDPTRNASQGWGLNIGQRLTAVVDAKKGYGSGNFGWVDFTPPGGGASELAGLLEGTGACGVKPGQLVGQSGQATSVQRAWNTRFGLYADASQALRAPPDFSGYGYANGAQQFSNYLQARTSRTPFQGTVDGSLVKLSAADHARWGQQRRIASAPVVDCSMWTTQGSATPPVLDLACVLLLAPVRTGSSPTGAGVAGAMEMEFLGLLSAAGTPCASMGAVGGVGGAVVPGLVQ